MSNQQLNDAQQVVRNTERSIAEQRKRLSELESELASIEQAINGDGGTGDVDAEAEGALALLSRQVALRRVSRATQREISGLESRLAQEQQRVTDLEAAALTAEIATLESELDIMLGNAKETAQQLAELTRQRHDLTHDSPLMVNRFTNLLTDLTRATQPGGDQWRLWREQREREQWAKLNGWTPPPAGWQPPQAPEPYIHVVEGDNYTTAPVLTPSA